MRNNKNRGIEGSKLDNTFDGNIEMTLNRTPKWINLLLLTYLLMLLACSLSKYSTNYVIFSFGLGIISMIPLIYLHEFSHAWTLKLLNNDSPTVQFGLKPCCYSQKPIPLKVFAIDLIAPLWIVFVFNGLIILNNINNKPGLSLSFIFTFLIIASAQDLYWLYLIRKIPKDRMVHCYGKKAIVYRSEEKLWR